MKVLKRSQQVRIVGINYLRLGFVPLLNISTFYTAPDKLVMVYMHFPAKFTEEEEMLQKKFAKLRKKVWITVCGVGDNMWS